jgi:hypothetical protein
MLCVATAGAVRLLAAYETEAGIAELACMCIYVCVYV